MHGDELIAAVTAELAARADSLGLDARSLKVEYVLNWGGFTNRSYRVTDGRRRLHLKLVDRGDGVRRWRKLHRHLEAHYHAPPMVGWISLPAGAEGPLFEHVPGAMPEIRTPKLLTLIEPVLTSLHRDAELAAHLGQASEPCRATLDRRLLRRFRTAVQSVRRQTPPFVPPSRVEWIEQEMERIKHQSFALAAFEEPAACPIHGDFWLDNLLVEEDGRLWVLDWDALSIGDPAMDWAMLLGATRGSLVPARSDELPAAARAPGLVERLPVYARAVALDWILGSLAVWIEADTVPAHADLVRTENERFFHAALEVYRATF